MLVRLTLTVALAGVLASGCGSRAGAPRRAHDLRAVAFLAPAPAGSALPASAVAAMHLNAANARRHGAFRDRTGIARGIWTATTAEGQACVLDVGPDQVGAGCGPTLFGGHRLAFTEAVEGGPGPSSTTAVRIAGVAAAGVDTVAVRLSDGSLALVTPNDAGAFVYEESPAEITGGRLPVELSAREGTAKQVDRIDLPRTPVVP